MEHHQLPLKRITTPEKISLILRAIKSPNDKLKDIKERIHDNNINYNEIEAVLANVKSKHKNKSINYQVDWYKKTNCFRKCYYNKKQREVCRIKFQQLIAKAPNIKFTKNEFLTFINNHTNICILKEGDKKRFVSYKEFKNKKART